MVWNTYRRRPGRLAHRPRAGRCDLARNMIAVLAAGAGLLLGACSIPLGNGSSGQSSQETPGDRNRLYWQEQEQLERQYQFDRMGPSDR